MEKDQVRIEDLEVYGYHGVLPEENVLGQKFLISVIFYLSTERAGREDALSFSIDYAEAAHVIQKKILEKKYKLIEAAAEHLAEELLLRFPLVDRLRLEIKKPWAPIGIPLDNVGVSIERGWERVYLSVGSNMGDREKNIRDAIEALRKDPKVRRIAVSSLAVTKPYGKTDQADFLNGAIGMETLYSPAVLLKRLHEIEKEGHRTREERWGPRTIDLDILLYGDAVVQTEELTIPHREMHLRAFVLEPMAELAPWEVHPLFHRTVMELKEMLHRDSQSENIPSEQGGNTW